MADDVNKDKKTPPPNTYKIKADAIKGEFVAAAQSATYAADQEISKKGITSSAEQREIYSSYQGATQKKASNKLATLMQPNTTRADVASLAQSAITRKNVPSYMMGMSDELLESQLQVKLAETVERRNNATNSIKAARFSNGVPQINKAFDDAVTGGAGSTQDAANLQAALNEKRRTGVSGNKIQSAIQETKKRRANFTEDAELKKQIDEGKLSRKDVETKYEADYSKFKRMSRRRDNLANRAEATQEIRNEAYEGFRGAVGKAVFESGGDKSEEDIIKENPALKAAEEALKKLDEQLARIGNSTVKAEKGLLNYNESLAKQERLLKSMPKDAKGGVTGFIQGGGGDAMIEAMGTAAQMYRRHAVGVPMREEKAKAGIANLALSRYNKQYAATQGDMSAYYEMIEDAGGAEAFGEQMSLRSKASNLIEGGLDVAGAGVGIATIITGGASQGVNKSLATGAKLAATALKGVAGGARAIDENAVIGAETKLEAILTKDQYNAAIAAMKSQGGQALYDQSMGAANVSIGSGNARALETKLSSIGGMQDALTRGNLSPQEFMQVTAQVGQSVYGANQDRGEIAIRAGEMQKKRVMTTDQFTQAMGIQSAAGGSVGGLESTMKRAVAAGVNDSKLLVEFAQLSANLNQSLTDAGTSAENHTAYSNRVQQMREAGVSEVLATRAAASQIGSIDAMLQDTGVTEASIIKAGMIEKMVPNATTAERIYMQTATSGELGAILKENLTADEEKSMLPAAKGVRKKIMGAAGGLAAGRVSASEMGEVVSMADVGLMAQYQMDKTNPKGVGESAAEIRDAHSRRHPGKVLSFDEVAGKEFTDQSGMAEQRKGDQGQAALNQIEQAAKALGGVEETFRAITESLKVITANLDANKSSDEAKKAAQDLDPNGNFNAAVGKFDQAVEKMRGKMGITPVTNLKRDNAKYDAGSQYKKDAKIDAMWGFDGSGQVKK